MKIYKDGNVLKVYVRDTGDGIKLEDLPRSTLLAGYSSRKSLGQGLNILLKFMDRVFLSTNSQGTTLVLEKDVGNDTQVFSVTEKNVVDK